MDWKENHVRKGITGRYDSAGNRWDFSLKNPSVFFSALEELARVLGVEPNQMICGRQPHGTEILRIDKIPKEFSMLEGYDGYVSNKAAVVLATFHADCVPLYFYDPRRKAIGMAHAGWRGTVKGMAGMMVDRMAKEFGSRPQDLLVEIGPCISAAGYEVDLPVMEACRAITGETGLTQVNRDHGHVDLAAVNHRILLMKGVERCNISIDPRKTDEKLEEFYSHRKEGDAAGRTVAWITLEGETGEKTFVRRRAKKEHKISEKTS